MSKIKPNIVRGGQSIDLGNNMFLMQGRPHSRGGIDIGKNLEVEGGEVMQYKPNEIRVFSKEPILNGISPAQYVLGGANPNDVFNAQEYWKRVNRVSDDGKKYVYGGQNENNNDNKNDKKDNNEPIDETDENFVGPPTPEDVRARKNISDSYKQQFYNLAKGYKEQYPNYAYFLEKAGEYYGDRMGVNEANLIDYTNPSDIIYIEGTKKSNVPVPKPLLDSLALNAAKVGVSPYEALGLANQESRFGYFPTAFYNPQAIRDQKEVMPLGYGMDKGYLTPIEILNDAAYGNNPYLNTLSYVAQKHNVSFMFNDSVHLPKPGLSDDVLIELEKDLKNSRAYADREALKMSKPGSIFEHAFNVYKTGKYNPGDANHTSDVINAGKDVFNSPQIKEWWNKEGRKYYEKYAPEFLIGFKYGGRINKPVNMDFNYIIGKNNIYKLGGRKKAPLGIDILNSQNLHRNAEVFDGVPAIVVDEQVIRPNVNTEQQRLLDEASQIINNSIQASVNRDASTLNRISQIEGINGPVTIDGRRGTIRPDGTIDLQNRYTLAGDNRGVGYKSISERNKLLRQAKVRNAVNNIKQGIKDNSSELLSTGINLAGNLAGSLINLNAINKMKYYDIIPLRANKLKTNVNINPQLDTLREQLARFEGDTRNNTSSSKVALARRQSARARTAQAINQLFGTKENLQTELINRDRLNQQQVGNMNVQMRNRWRAGKSQFDNQIRNLRAENAIAGINNAIAAFNGENGYFNTRDKKFNEQANRALYALTAPNAVDAITSKNAEKLINTFVEPRFRKRMRRSLGIED